MQIIAIIACVIAAVLGALSLTVLSTSMQVVGYVTDVWVLGWLIVNKAYTREYWTDINRPIMELVNRRVKASPSGLARVLTIGMIVLVIFGTVLMFTN